MAQGPAINDDFGDGTINTSIWSATGSVTESGGSVTLTGANGTCLLKSISPYLFQKGCTFETYGNITRTLASGHYIGFAHPGAGNAQCLFYNGWNQNTNIHINHSGDNGTNVDTDSGVACSTSSTKHTFKIVWRLDGMMEFYIDGSLKYTSVNAVEGTTYPMPFQLGNVYDSGHQMVFDYATLTTPDGKRINLLGSSQAVKRASFY